MNAADDAEPKRPRGRHRGKKRDLRDGAGEWYFTHKRINELAESIEIGELVYLEPRGDDDVAAARRGEVPGFADLQAKLAHRGIALVTEAPFYWRAVELSRP